uniref:Uncharacterized protein n=1 Tax=Nelumbo nucifera TaxID=4432 RepID=A0A822Z3B4_NELNU|nr:TPA_asm: hypothetical protein HUJ06_013835 [Nelumbo nucifera]
MEEEYRRIEIRRITPTSISNDNLYAVVYMDRDSNSRQTIHFSNANASNPKMEFEVKESNIQNGSVHLVIELRRQGTTCVDRHVGEVRIAIRDLFHNRDKAFFRIRGTTLTTTIQKSRWFGFGRQKQQGGVDIKYDFGRDTFLKNAEAPVQGHMGQILCGVAKLLASISSIVTISKCIDE